MTQKEVVEVGSLLDQKYDEIKAFYKQNFEGLPLSPFQFTSGVGYSPDSKLLQVTMEQYLELLNEYKVLLDKTYRAISQNEAGRRKLEKSLRLGIGFRRITREAEQELSELVDIARKDNLDQKYWKQRGVISQYCNLCARQYAPCSKAVSALQKLQELPDFTHCIVEIIAASIECSRVHSELMLCFKMLGKEAEVDECRKFALKPAQLVLLALDIGISEFDRRGEHQVLRDVLKAHENYYQGWIDNYNPELDRSLDDSDTAVTSLIIACLVMDQPQKGVRFAHHFLQNVQKEKYDYKAVI